MVLVVFNWYGCYGDSFERCDDFGGNFPYFGQLDVVMYGFDRIGFIL